MSTIERIKTDPSLVLKPNEFLADPSIPYLYQRRGALMMVARPRMLLGDDVGLGKTLQTIVALTYLKTRHPEMKTLVLTEVAAMRQWQREFAWIAPGLQTQVIGAVTGPASMREAAFLGTRADVVISSPSMVRLHSEEILHTLGRGYTVIFDEPPFRNPKSQISELCKVISTGAARAYALTATMIEGNLVEAFGLFDVLVPGLFPTKSFFETHWCETEPVFWDWKWDSTLKKKVRKARPWPRRVIGYKNLRKFKEWISPVYYARLQTNPEVDQALPDVIEKVVPIQLGYEQSARVIAAERGVLTAAGEPGQELMVLESLTRCQQLVDDPRVLDGPGTSSPKIDALIELLEGSLAGQQVLVFSRFAKVAELIQSELKFRLGIDAGMIQGSASAGAREAAQDDFQADPPRSSVLILTLAGGRALNLQKGGHLIFFDGPFLYGQERQLIGRLKRTGSLHRRILAWYFLAELHPQAARDAGASKLATIDHHLRRCRAAGQKLFEAVIGDSGEHRVKREKAVGSWVAADMRRNEVELG